MKIADRPLAKSISRFFSELTTGKAALILAVAGLLTYANTFLNGFAGDDAQQLMNSGGLQAAGGLLSLFNGDQLMSQAYYKPLFAAALALLQAIFGNGAWAFHGFQLALHVAAAALTFLILGTFLKKPLALLLSLVFLIHPINSEAVYYVSDLQDVLFLFFGLLAIWIQIKVAGRWGLPLVAAGLFLSLISKETGVLFLAVAVSYSWLFRRRDFPRTLGLAALVLVSYVILRLGTYGFLTAPSWVRIAQLGLVERLANVPAMVAFYLRTFLFPVQLSVSRVWVISGLTLTEFWLPLAVDLLAVAALVLLGIRLKRSGRSHYWRTYLFFAAWLAVGLLLHLQLFPLDATVADRWFYFPIIGLLGLVGVSLEAFGLGGTGRRVWPVVAVMLVLMAGRTFVRGLDWRNGVRLVLHDSVYAQSDVLDNRVAMYLNMSGQPQEALTYAQQAVEMNPSSENLQRLGSTLLVLGHDQQARRIYVASWLARADELKVPR